MKNIIEELQWRGLVHDIMPGTEEQLLKEMTTTYIGFDPTSDSLHIGSLVPIILLVHLENFGHKPIALVGGATGMIGDPSGRNATRPALTLEATRINGNSYFEQASKILHKEKTKIVYNSEWLGKMSFEDVIKLASKYTVAE